MAQTSLGKQAAQQVRRQQRLEDYKSYDDLSMLKKVMSNQPSSTEFSRQLTIEDKQFEKSKEGVDEVLGQLSSYIMDSKGNIRNDLSNDDIIDLAKHITPLKKSAERIYNRDGNYELENYTNNQYRKLINTLDGMVKSNNMENDLGVIEQQIKDLGDETSYIHPRHGENVYLDRGDYDISEGAKTILNNIRTLSDNYRQVKGDDVKDLFAPFEEKLNKKFAVFEDMNYYQSPEAQEILATSPKAQAVFNEALRLFNTKGEEDITTITTLLDKIPTELGESAEKNLTAANEYEDSIKEVENKKFDNRVNLNLKQLNATAKGGSQLDDDFRDTMQSFASGRVGAFNDPDLSLEFVGNVLQPRLLTILSEGIKKVKSTKDADNELDINKAIQTNDFDTIYQYFTSKVRFSDPKDKSIKTYGDLRIKNMVSNRGNLKNKNQSNHIKLLLNTIKLINDKHANKIPIDDIMNIDKDEDGVPDFIDRDAGAGTN